MENIKLRRRLAVQTAVLPLVLALLRVFDIRLDGHRKTALREARTAACAVAVSDEVAPPSMDRLPTIANSKKDGVSEY